MFEVQNQCTRTLRFRGVLAGLPHTTILGFQTGHPDRVRVLVLLFAFQARPHLMTSNFLVCSWLLKQKSNWTPSPRTLLPGYTANVTSNISPALMAPNESVPLRPPREVFHSPKVAHMYHRPGSGPFWRVRRFWSQRPLLGAPSPHVTARRSASTRMEGTGPSAAKPSAVSAWSPSSGLKKTSSEPWALAAVWGVGRLVGAETNHGG